MAAKPFCLAEVPEIPPHRTGLEAFMKSCSLLLLCSYLCLSASRVRAQCPLTDDFESGTAQGWSTGTAWSVCQPGLMSSFAFCAGGGHSGSITNPALVNRFGGLVSTFFYIDGDVGDYYISFVAPNGDGFEVAIMPVGSDNPTDTITSRLSGVDHVVTAPHIVATQTWNELSVRWLPGVSVTAILNGAQHMQLLNVPDVAGDFSVRAFSTARCDNFSFCYLSPSGYCFGDGSGVACPCGNTGANGHGCGNSLNPGGAQLSATGQAQITGDTVLFSATGMSGNVSLYVQGTGQADSAFDDGKVCLSGSFLRIGLKANTAGASSNPSGVDQSISVKGQVPSSGATRYYQVVYRNIDPSFCTPATTNRTNGISLVWTP